MEANTAAVISRVPKSTMESAVNALFKYKSSNSAATEKLQLLPEDDYIYLNLTLKKIPSKSRTNPFKISLPHPLLDFSSQLCLIIDDRPQSPTPPSDQIKKLIKSQNLPISKVIRVSKLKTNYKPFEAKRKLCDSYDLFLVDKRVMHLMPKLIGKEFFKKKKLPLGVDLSKKNLKLQVDSILGSSLLYLRTGTCCVMKVGKISMEKDEVAENVVSAIRGAVEKVPKKWDGVRSFHLKFCGSIALPIYQAMPDLKLKIVGLKDREHEIEVARISDNEGEVKDNETTKDGNIRKKKNKGRIHEVQYMDIGEGIETGDEEIEPVGNEDNEEFEGNLTKDEDLSVDRTVGKKRSKSKALKEGVLGGSDGAKKSKKERLSSVKHKKRDSGK